MTIENRKDLGKVLKQHRVMMSLTLNEVSRAANVSPSHLGRIERGERYPSARILRRLAKPLGLEEVELFTLAEYMSPQLHSDSGDVPRTRPLDPYVAGVLSQEPVEIQRAVIVILSAMKSMAKGMSLTERPMNATSTVERVRRES